ncbi:MAG: sugar ABC transporter permease [Acidobacteria bacterium]|nr:sugar ABC transporter permease [Acidobacteriota bacterium]MCA1627138.1 sugar ABC transporter permease [Acidobacteriota bacterium]
MPRSRRFSSALNRRELLLPYLLVAPALVVLLALSIYPLLYSITISLQQETPAGVVWTLGHFKRLASDNFFRTAMVHTFVFAAAALTCEFLLGLGLALLLNQQIRGRGLFRASLLVPMMLPTVVVGVVWRLMLNPNFGAINGTLKQVGINTESLTWTASPRLAFLAVIAVDVWQWTPFVFLVLLAGLQAIPQEPYEAALIDGSSRWQTFRHVTLPLLKPAILIVLLLRTMDLLRVFDQIFILTEGGPGFATEMISLYIYRAAFRFFDFGYAAAMSFVLLAVTNVVSVVYIRLLQAKA